MPRKRKASKKRVSIKSARSKASRKDSVKRKTLARKERQAAEVVGLERKIEGHGKYKSKGIGKAMGGAAGGALASAVGMPFLAPFASMAGSALGDFAESGLGGIIEKIFGSGKYTAGTETMPLANGIHKNSFLLPEIGSHVEFGTDSQGEFIRVVKREFVQDILSSTAPYSVQVTLPLTPCNQALSPWMSQLVNLFQNYSYDGLVFEFVTLTSPTIVSGVPGIQTGGYVGLITRTNPDLPAPADKQSALELEHAQTAPPWVPQCHPVECAVGLENQPYLFVEGRTGLPLNASAPLYRHGVTYVVCGDQPSAGVKMGELWASQAIKVRFPSLDNPLPIYAHWSTGVTNVAAPLGTTVIQRTGFNSGVLIIGPTVMQFPTSIGSDRFYLVTLSTGGNAAAGISGLYGVTSASANITGLTAFTDFTAMNEVVNMQMIPDPGQLTRRVQGSFLFKVSRVASGEVTNNQVLFTYGGTNPSTSGDLFVSEISSAELANGLFMPKAPTLVPFRMIGTSTRDTPTCEDDDLVGLSCGDQDDAFSGGTLCPRPVKLSLYARKAYTQWLVDSPTATVEQQLALSDALKRLVGQFDAGILDRKRAENMIGLACSHACLEHL